MKTKYSYKQIWTISYPILISLIMEQMIGMTDTAFLGCVGEIELGASAIAGVYYLAIFMMAFGFSIGAQILIAYHIRKYHHNRVQSQRLGLRRTYKEGAEHHHDKREEEPVHTPMNITLGCIVNVRRRNDILEDIW